MKPIKLTMSAFGPYRDVVEVDFSKFGDNGIFLITGDTGAGKTTIFDGISYALFGKSSGSNRDAEFLRSKFALDSVKTYVELEFLANGKVYKVNRSLSYLSPKKRGTGTTSHPAEAYLECDDKVLETNTTNVTKCIEDILGINSNQFKQIAMLAQGEFLKVLFAESSEREKIFRKIFSTERFDMITNRLSEIQSKKKNELESLKVEFRTNANNINGSNNGFFDNREITSETVNQIIADLKKDIESRKTEREILLKELDEKEKNYKVKEVEINKIEENNKKILDYQKLINKKKELDERKDEIEQAKQKINNYDKTMKDIKPLENNLSEIESNINLINLEINKLNESIKEYEKQLDLIQGKEDKFKQLESFLEIFNKNKENINSLLDNKTNIDGALKLYNELNGYHEKYHLCNKEYEELTKEYMSEEDKFFRNQAGILASKLENEKPCPVCGSIEHPNIAHIEESVLNKDDLEKLKEQVDNKQSKLNQVKEDIISINSKIQTYNDKLNCKNKEELEKIKEETNSLYSKIEEEQKEITIRFNDTCFFITNKKSSIEEFNMINFMNEFNKNNQNIKDNVTKDKTKLEENNNRLDELNNKLKKLKEDILKKIIELGFKDEDDYKTNVISDNQYKTLCECLDKYKEDVTTVSVKLSTYEKELIDFDIVDLKDVKEELSFISSEIQELKGKVQNKTSLYDNNVKIKENLEKISKRLIISMKNYSSYEYLYKIASGKATGKRRVSFEQYVQATYFDMVVYEANKRFSSMTDGRFSLLRKNSGDASLNERFALDLDVYDEYTGSKRDVKSLSGGESFKAALSLALGLSDVVQNFSGGIKIDALFIDEGFGSLDDESREQAINILHSLSGNNKLIGIISHVSELKDRIDKKIIVTKNRDGSGINLVA